jgi:hypothetical protein
MCDFNHVDHNMRLYGILLKFDAHLLVENNISFDPVIV